MRGFLLLAPDPSPANDLLLMDAGDGDGGGRASGGGGSGGAGGGSAGGTGGALGGGRLEATALGRAAFAAQLPPEQALLLKVRSGTTIVLRSLISYIPYKGYKGAPGGRLLKDDIRVDRKHV